MKVEVTCLPIGEIENDLNFSDQNSEPSNALEKPGIKPKIFLHLALSNYKKIPCKELKF